VFCPAFQKTKKQLSKNDQPGKTWEDDGPAEIKKLSEALQLGAYTILALNKIAEFTTKSSWEKLEKTFGKFEDILVALCENNDKNQTTMCGLVEMCIQENKRKMLPFSANIFKKLYDDDILSDKNILAWSEKPTKKYTSKKFVQKIVDNENMTKLLEWMKEDDDSSSESESDEETDEEKTNEPEASVDVEKTTVPAAKEEPAAAAAASSDDDEDIDIDNI